MIAVPAFVRGLVFDCDGTLADTMPAHYVAWSTALNEQGCPFPLKQFYEYAGMPTRKILALLNQQHGLSMHIEDVFTRKESIYLESIHTIAPIEEVVAVARRYASILPMAVATGGTRDVIERTLIAVGLKGVFEHVVTADDVAHPKPAPDVFLESARRIGISPVECAAFEDADLGIQSARAAGMYVVDVREHLPPVAM